jgi:hypothetical protein
MIRIVLDIDEDGDILAIKESIAMALESFGRVRVVSIYDGNTHR